VFYENREIEMYSTITLPVVLCGCEAWSHTLWENHRLRVFENRVPRKIFGFKRDEITGERRRLHDEELYSTSNIIMFFLWRCGPTRAMASSFTRFVDHNETPQSVGLLWTSDQPLTETST